MLDPLNQDHVFRTPVPSDFTSGHCEPNSAALCNADTAPSWNRSEEAVPELSSTSRRASHGVQRRGRGDDAPRAPLPRLADLDELVAGVRTSGLDVRVERSGPIDTLSCAVELAASRIIQEAPTTFAVGIVLVELSPQRTTLEDRYLSIVQGGAR